MRYKLFVDMDGVLADFSHTHFLYFGYYPERGTGGKGANWEGIKNHPYFFRQILPKSDMHQLWRGIILDFGFDPTILTAAGHSMPEWGDDKKYWMRNWLGDYPIIICQSSEKKNYSEPDAILIDDHQGYEKDWTKKGGIFIHHKSATETLQALYDLVYARG